MTNNPEGFYKQMPDIGDFYLRPLRDADIPWVHDWVNRDYARFWGQQNSSLEEVAAFYRDLAACGHARAYLGLHNRQPAFLMESYQPAHDPIGSHYEVQPGDHGMHVLVAPAEQPLPGTYLP